MRRFAVILLMGLFLGGCSTINEFIDDVSDVLIPTESEAAGEAKK
mgnify:CR=1 FL=1